MLKMTVGRKAMTINAAMFDDVFPTRDGLIRYLNSEGLRDLACAVEQGEVNQLPSHMKDKLKFIEVAYKNQIARENSRSNMEALVIVSTSGWSREPETTLPGKVDTIMRADRYVPLDEG